MKSVAYKKEKKKTIREEKGEREKEARSSVAKDEERLLADTTNERPNALSKERGKGNGDGYGESGSLDPQVWQRI